MGCYGGLMDSAFTYAESAKMEKLSDYPYTAHSKLNNCQYNASLGQFSVTSFCDVANSAQDLKNAISHAPTSVAIEADQAVFQQYTSGVITSGCGSNLDHGVLAVGYGTSNGTDYVIVKNSWGPSWGMDGYVNIAYDQCGITTGPPSVPTTN